MSAIQSYPTNAGCETPIAGDFEVDKCIAGAIPNGGSVVSAETYGKSSRVKTARLLVEAPDGRHRRYFLKSGSGTAIRAMLLGEYVSISEIRKFMPDFAPEPYALSTFEKDGDEVTFLLSEYLEMPGSLPDPTQFCRKLARLHRESVSPTGMFGFSFRTFNASLPHDFGWELSWTVKFTKLMRNVLSVDIEENEIWKDYNTLGSRLVESVIPVLIGALENEGRSIKPCLIHGDPWEGNTATCPTTGNISMFDAGVLYAHNEFEIGDWRCPYNKVHQEIYTKTYLSEMEPSDPKDQWEDRNRMYSIHWNIRFSAQFKQPGKAIRQLVYEDMYYLIQKYAPFPADHASPPPISAASKVNLPPWLDHNNE